MASARSDSIASTAASNAQPFNRPSRPRRVLGGAGRSRSATSGGRAHAPPPGGSRVNPDGTHQQAGNKPCRSPSARGAGVAPLP